MSVVTRDLYVIRVCPLCGGDQVQLAHGRCARECRGQDGVIPAMVDLEVMPRPPADPDTSRDTIYR